MTSTDQPRPAEHAEQRCNDPYPHPYTAASDEQRLCELEAGHPNRGLDDHRWGIHAWRDRPQHAPSTIAMAEGYSATADLHAMRHPDQHAPCRFCGRDGPRPTEPQHAPSGEQMSDGEIIEGWKRAVGSQYVEIESLRAELAQATELLDFVRKTRLWVSARGPMRQTAKDHLIEWADRLLLNVGEEP